MRPKPWLAHCLPVVAHLPVLPGASPTAVLDSAAGVAHRCATSYRYGDGSRRVAAAHLGLERYQEAFRENDISDAILPSLTAEDQRYRGCLGRPPPAVAGSDRCITPRCSGGRRCSSGRTIQLDPASPSVAERRQLSVMSCDMIGITALSSRLDPEDLSAVIRGYQAQATTTIARFGGFIARYVGDGVLIYFGWPDAHEANAESGARRLSGRQRSRSDPRSLGACCKCASGSLPDWSSSASRSVRVQRGSRPQLVRHRIELRACKAWLPARLPWSLRCRCHRQE